MSTGAEQFAGLLFAFSRQVPRELQPDFLRGVFWLLAAALDPARQMEVLRQIQVLLNGAVLERRRYFNPNSWLPLAQPEVVPAGGAAGQAARMSDEVDAATLSRPVVLTTIAGWHSFEERVELIRGALGLSRNLWDVTSSLLASDTSAPCPPIPGADGVAAQFLSDRYRDVLREVDGLGDMFEVRFFDEARNEREKPSLRDRFRLGLQDLMDTVVRKRGRMESSVRSELTEEIDSLAADCGFQLDKETVRRGSAATGVAAAPTPNSGRK